jgi:hypothetical protein
MVVVLGAVNIASPVRPPSIAKPLRCLYVVSVVEISAEVFVMVCKLE